VFWSISNWLIAPQSRSASSKLSQKCVNVFVSVGRVILDTYMWYTNHLHCIVHSLR
jgi:hypothetical protein